MTVATYAAAAGAFAQLVGDIPAEAWDGPGLGDWDLRSLVGHTSRSLSTVLTYAPTHADTADIATPQDYYVQIAEIAASIGPADIVERGRQAGRDLGDDPAATVDRLVETTLALLAETEDHPIRVIGGLAIRLHTYLPTRTFELAVHGLDIAQAAGISFALPTDVLTAAVDLAGRIAVAKGHGPATLLALTGRAPLPDCFSVL